MKIEKRFKPTKRKGKTPKDKITSPKKKGPLLEFIILGSGKNIHKTVSYSETAKYVSEANPSKIKYEVNPDNLLVVKPFLRKKKLVAIFQKDGTPVKIERSDNKVTAEILELANRSTALSRTIKEMFTTHLNMKKILFFVIVGVIGVVVVLILTGGIRI